MLVKPPSLEDLLETYGSLEKVIKHLTESGYSLEEIERKYHIPYYRIKLILANLEPKRGILFSSIAEVYNRTLTFRSVKGKETELIRFFKRKELSFEEKVRFALGRLVDENLKVGPGIIEMAIAEASNVPQSQIRKLFIDYGDYGDVASIAITREKPKLTVDEVYNSIRLLPRLEKISERILFISSLLRNSTSNEARYIVRLILGDLKLGYHEPTIISAMSRAFNVSIDALHHACATLGILDGLLLVPKGEDILRKEAKLRPGKFIMPQLAHLFDPDKVKFPVLVEYKFDGSRLQLHKWGTSVWLFSRRAVEKSETLPEIAQIIKEFQAHSCIIDSEVIAIDEEGRALKFQDLLHRTVPREFEEERAKEVGLTIRAFDILYLDGREIISLPLEERRDYLRNVVPFEYISEGTICYNEADIIRFYESALKKGYEGILVKSLKSIYEVGKRTHNWLKFKPERDSIDCVIVKALYGKGRRAGYYSSYELAVRDPIKKRLYTIGRVSNIPDLWMAVFRETIEKTKISEDKEGVYVKPKIILEVTYQEIQKTDEYASGFALRVPKVVRVRLDKSIEEIDDIEKIGRLYEMQYEERYKLKTI